MLQRIFLLTASQKFSTKRLSATLTFLIVTTFGVIISIN